MSSSPSLFSGLNDYRLLGNSGLRVSPLCYGCMNIADSHMTTDEQSRECIEEYMRLGGNFFDTANVYEGGKSEELLGRILAQNRSRAVIATKYSITKDPMNVNSGGNSRKCMVESLDASLKRMQLDSVDILYAHVWEYRTPVEEVMRAFDDCVRSGKVHYIAISDCPAWKISQANTLAMLRGFTPFCCLQTQFSLTERTAERDLLPMCQEFGIGVVPWGPLAQGMLTGKYNHLSCSDAVAKRQELSMVGSDRTQQNALMDGVDTFRPGAVLGDWTEFNRGICLKVAEIAAECGRSSTQVALNWNLQQPAICSPIMGPRTLAQLQDNVAALDFTLTKDQLAALDTVSKDPKPSFPQRWGDFSMVRKGAQVEQPYGSPFYKPK